MPPSSHSLSHHPGAASCGTPVESGQALSWLLKRTALSSLARHGLQISWCGAKSPWGRLTVLNFDRFWGEGEISPARAMDK